MKRAGAALRAVLVWGAGLAVSLGLGALADLLLSAQARQAAVGFQARALAGLSGFSPLNLLNALQEAWNMTLGGSYEGHPLVRIGGALFTFVASLHRALQQGGVVPAWMVWGFHGLMIANFLLVGLLLKRVGSGATQAASTSSAGGRTPQLQTWTSGALAALAIAGSYGLSVVMVATGLWLLKWIGVAGLLLFGWITQLAGLAAVAGAVSSSGYYVAVKASEKRIGEAAESLSSRLLSRFIRRAAS